MYVGCSLSFVSVIRLLDDNETIILQNLSRRSIHLDIVYGIDDAKFDISSPGTKLQVKVAIMFDLGHYSVVGPLVKAGSFDSRLANAENMKI